MREFFTRMFGAPASKADEGGGAPASGESGSSPATTAAGGAPAAASGGGGGHWTMDGFIPNSWGVNYWQRGYDPIPAGPSAVVEACISAYAQTIAMCPGGHWRVRQDGGRELVTTSALSRILRKPNGYQGISDFLLNLTQQLYQEGNAYAFAMRNSRFEIESLHLMDARQSRGRPAVNGDVFYALGGNPIAERLIYDSGRDPRVLGGAVPARDVLHVKLHTIKNDPLLGASPILSVAIDEATSNAIAAQALAFYRNQSRPSGTLESEYLIKEDEMQALREMWEEQSQGMNAGRVPILSAGLKWNPMTSTARDGQLAEIMGYTDKRVASVFRVPPELLFLDDKTGPQSSTETLMQYWIATGLGFAINHIEEPIGRLFGLAGLPSEYFELDMSALLRAAFKDRVEAFARGVQGGIFSPNEARAEFEFGAADYGDEPRVQQQVVPLSAWAKTPPATPAPPAPPPAPATPPPEEPPQGATYVGDWTKLILDAADRADADAA